MSRITKADLKKRVNLAARQYGISSVLFRHLVGERLGVNVTDMECLGLLFHKGLASPTELAAYTGLTSGAATAMLDRLEQAGLIQRRPNPSDRRGTLIVLDEAGVRRIGPWFAPVRKKQDELVARYTQDELEVVLDFLERSARIFDDDRLRLQRARTAAQKPG